MKRLWKRITDRLTRGPVLGHVEAIPSDDSHILRIPVVFSGHRLFLALAPHEMHSAIQRAETSQLGVCRSFPRNPRQKALWPVVRTHTYRRLMRSHDSCSN